MRFACRSHAHAHAPQASKQPSVGTSQASKGETQTPTVTTSAPPKAVRNCTCGLPMCVCPADASEAKQDAPRPKPQAAPAEPKKPVFFSPQKSTFSGFGIKHTPLQAYDLKGDLNEQSKDAVKAGDLQGLTKLLDAGGSAGYQDSSGNSLLHLAALFNHTEIVMLLHQRGAKLSVLNHSKERPLDVAPPALQFKMKALLEGGP
jgi:ankyrin repeat protein